MFTVEKSDVRAGLTDQPQVEVPFEVQKEHDGMRVDAFLAAKLHRYSRAEVVRLLEAGRVVLRGRAPKPAARVAHGETVLIRYPRREEPPALAERLEVLYDDDSLVAVAKPAGVLSHPTDRVTRNTATSILRAQFGRGLLLAHRLDRETSGVLLLAKDRATARALTDAFTRRRVSKEYLAIVRGRVGFREKVVDLPLGKEGLEIKVRQAVSPASGGVPAVTELRREKAGALASLVRAAPRTGRLHQIRVHLAALGHPVLGDKLYTGAGETYLKACRKEVRPEDLEALGAERQMLHAERLTLEHPASGRLLTVVAPPPKDFLACLRRVGLR